MSAPTAPNTVLPKPYVIIAPTPSVLGLASPAPDGGLDFGTVVAVYATSDRTKVNDNVIYRTDMAKKIIDTGLNNFIMIEEDGITSKEIPPPMM